MNTHFETYEQSLVRQQYFAAGKKSGQLAVLSVPVEQIREIAIHAAHLTVEAQKPDSPMPYAYAQGYWHGVDYHGDTLSSIISMEAGVQ